jgi:curved DNA-binding protein CbpA
VGAPLAVKLRCPTWRQLAAIYRRDLTQGKLFLRSQRPPAQGTRLVVELVLPSGSLVPLAGVVEQEVAPGGQGGRGPGLLLALEPIPGPTLWLLESALAASGELAGTDAATLPGSPPLEEDAALGGAEDELVGALEQELEGIRKLNPFQVLNVGYGADDDAIRLAFGELARRYHPDRFARYATSRAREVGSEIFLVIRNAYKQLGEPAARHRTLRQLGRDARGRPIAELARPAQVAFDPADDPPAAPDDASRPIEIVRPETPASGGEGGGRGDPRDGALAAIERGEYDQAAMLFTMILKHAPGDPPARAGIELARGLRALAERDRLEAAQRFEAVLAIDPTNERAARELAEMRRKNTKERTGMLARLLGKERR